MKNGKYSNKKGLNMKPLALLLALTLLVGCAIGGTIAWLTAQTGEVANTFTVGDINITLQEHKLENGVLTDDLLPTTQQSGNAYHFVPGDKLPKDPFVTVLANSEDCYVFIKVVSENNTATDDDAAANPATVENILSWSVTNDWTHYKDVSGNDSITSYYYKTFTKNAADQSVNILVGEGEGIYKNGLVRVSTDVVKELVDEINAEGSKPTLKFEAAAIQSQHIDDATDAWNNLPEAFTGESEDQAPTTTEKGVEGEEWP